MICYCLAFETHKLDDLLSSPCSLSDINYILERKIAHYPELFTSCSSLRTTLGLFPYRYWLLDAAEILLENEVQLVEAAFGRIKSFSGTARIVLDEPFVLKVTLNYFRENYPSSVSAAERAMLHSDNALVQGNMWENMIVPIHNTAR